MNSTPLPCLAILAGGLATRLGSLTTQTPKALLSIAGKPFLSHQLDLLASAGFTQVVLCIGHLGEQIEESYGNSYNGIEIQYSYDGDTLLGTGGALKKAIPLAGDTFGILYGDSYLPIDYLAAWQTFIQSPCPALMTVYENADLYDKSNVLFVDGQLQRYNKKLRSPEMRHIDYGLSYVKASIFDEWPSDKAFDLADVLTGLSDAKQLAGYEVHQRFYEIGSEAGLKELEQILRNPTKPIHTL